MQIYLLKLKMQAFVQIDMQIYLLKLKIQVFVQIDMKYIFAKTENTSICQN